jgi:hypothetical protein
MVSDMESYPPRSPLDTMLGSPPEIRSEWLETNGADGFDVSCEVVPFPGAGESGARTPRSQGFFFSPDTSHDTRSSG